MSFRATSTETVGEFRLVEITLADEEHTACASWCQHKVFVGWEAWCERETCLADSLATLVTHDEAVTAVAEHVHEYPPADIAPGMRAAVARAMRTLGGAR